MSKHMQCRLISDDFDVYLDTKEGVIEIEDFFYGNKRYTIELNLRNRKTDNTIRVQFETLYLDTRVFQVNKDIYRYLKPKLGSYMYASTYDRHSYFIKLTRLLNMNNKYDITISYSLI